jgi:ubiquitin C-terminal hydrolase
MSLSKMNNNLSGIHNYGYNCFINSILQCMKFSSSIISGIINEEEHRKDIEYLRMINSCNEDEIETDPTLKEHNIDISRIKKLNIYFHFKKLIIELCKNNITVDPQELIMACKKDADERGLNDLFCGNQCDAEEFLTFLLDSLHEAKIYEYDIPLTYSVVTDDDDVHKKIIYNSEEKFKKEYSQKYSWVLKELFNKQATITNCSNCSYYTINYDSQHILQLPILENMVSTSIYDYLNNYFGKEILDCWKCDSCDNTNGNSKQYRFIECPQTLIIQLKRFEYCTKRNSRFKIVKHVDYPLILNMSPYKLVNKSINSKYELFGVVNHRGVSPFGGHYYSYCKNIKSKKDNNWYKLNDETITQISSDKIINDNAYILFYQLIN